MFSTFALANDAHFILWNLMSSLRVRYQTIEFGDNDIHVRTLRDRQQFSDSGSDEAEKLGVSPASWPLFGVVWDSSHDITSS